MPGKFLHGIFPPFYHEQIYQRFETGWNLVCPVLSLLGFLYQMSAGTTYALANSLLASSNDDVEIAQAFEEDFETVKWSTRLLRSMFGFLRVFDQLFYQVIWYIIVSDVIIDGELEMIRFLEGEDDIATVEWYTCHHFSGNRLVF